MRKIAFLSYNAATGGAEKMTITLANEFARHGNTVDLVLLQKEGDFLPLIDAHVNVVSLNCPSTSKALFALRTYIQAAKPNFLFSNLTHVNILAVLACRFIKNPPKLYLIEHNTISLNNIAYNAKEKWITKIARFIYPIADQVIAVSQGAANDLAATLHLPHSKIKVIYNPLNINEIQAKAEECPDHPWLTRKDKPVLLSIGRLVSAKNFGLLLDVFNQVQQQIPCRLIILGEGEERVSLEQKASELGISHLVSLPGRKTNPYAIMAASDLFLCTSHYEGFHIALAEALACGLAVISVDCPHGPAEILEQGKYGTLVAADDQAGLVGETIDRLQKGITPEEQTRWQKRAEDFSLSTIFQQYKNLVD